MQQKKQLTFALMALTIILTFVFLLSQQPRLSAQEQTDTEPADEQASGTVYLPIISKAGSQPPPVTPTATAPPPNGGGSTIGDRVWIDTNSNGLQDDVEEGLGGVRVRIYGGSNNLLNEVTTIDTGKYSFTNLAAGVYFVEFVLPDQFKFTSRDQGLDDKLDSDADSQSGRTITFTMTGDNGRSNWDAGLRDFRPTPTPTATPLSTGFIGDKVWKDVNGDGLQTSGEAGVPNISVKLLRIKEGGGEQKVAQLKTDAFGGYIFTDLPPGTYVVQAITIPTGHSFTIKDADPADGKDSDVDPVTGRTDEIKLKEAGERRNIDIGFKEP